MNKYNISPFLKWAGGKRQLINEIKKRMPKEFKGYYEPFVGGGALFMELQINPTTINDISSELMNAYKVIRDNPHELMKILDIHEENHKKNPEEYYYRVRQQDRENNWHNQDIITQTARMIYLNKTCFNGLYRVNKNGYFNVPFNKKDTVSTYNRKNILSLSTYFQQEVNILNVDFEVALKDAKKGDFIFLDPPYDLLKKDTFDSYNPNGFGIDGQKRVSKIAHELDQRGCYVIITNHNTPLINELYSDFNIDVVSAKRMINSNSNNRKGYETIIYNYNLENV